MFGKWILKICVSIVLFWIANVQAIPPGYYITDLGTLEGDFQSRAYGINDAGQVVGRSVPQGQDLGRAFLWESGTMTDLGTLGGDYSEAYDINNSGQVIGWAKNSSARSHAFLWENGTMTDLGTLGGDHSIAYGINNLGHIVGLAENSSARSHAFLWENGTMTDLGTLGGVHSIAYGINDACQVAGNSLVYTGISGQNSRAFLWESGTMNSIGTLGGDDSYGRGINNSGQIVGYSDIDGYPTYYHAFLWDNDQMIDLGTLGGRQFSKANAINDYGQVVGTSQETAFLWESGTIVNLNDLLIDGFGWTLYEATAINNSGQIVGYGEINGEEHGFLMTPIPEPSTLALTVYGACLLKKRKKIFVKS